MILLSLLLAATPAAAAPPAPPAASAAPARPAPITPEDFLTRMAASWRVRGVSPAGVQIIRDRTAAQITSIERLSVRERAVRASLIAALNVTTVDVPAVEAALHARDAVAVERINVDTTATIETLRALSPADRLVVAHALAAPRTPPAPPASSGH